LSSGQESNIGDQDRASAMVRFLPGM